MSVSGIDNSFPGHKRIIGILFLRGRCLGDDSVVGWYFASDVWRVRSEDRRCSLRFRRYGRASNKADTVASLRWVAVSDGGARQGVSGVKKGHFRMEIVPPAVAA